MRSMHKIRRKNCYYYYKERNEIQKRRKKTAYFDIENETIAWEEYFLYWLNYDCTHIDSYSFIFIYKVWILTRIFPVIIPSSILFLEAISALLFFFSFVSFFLSPAFDEHEYNNNDLNFAFFFSYSRKLASHPKVSNIRTIRTCAVQRR